MAGAVSENPNALAVARATCLNSDPRARIATKHCHPSRLKHAFAPTSARFARRVSTPFWAMSARTAVVVSFLGQSDRRQIGKATTSLAKIPRVPRSSTGPLTLKLMPGSRPQSKTFRPRNVSVQSLSRPTPSNRHRDLSQPPAFPVDNKHSRSLFKWGYSGTR